jgi:hypothetical protein
MNEFEANGYFISYDDVLSSDVNVVDLIVSHDSHESMGRSAMESGKHLVLEKPIGRTEEEGISLIETSNPKLSSWLWKTITLTHPFGKLKNSRLNLEEFLQL